MDHVETSPIIYPGVSSFVLLFIWVILMFAVVRVVLTDTLPSKSKYFPAWKWTCLYLFFTFFDSCYGLSYLSYYYQSNSMKYIKGFIFPTYYSSSSDKFYSLVINMFMFITHFIIEMRLQLMGLNVLTHFLPFFLVVFSPLLPLFFNHVPGHEAKKSC